MDAEVTEAPPTDQTEQEPTQPTEGEDEEQTKAVNGEGEGEGEAEKKGEGEGEGGEMPKQENGVIAEHNGDQQQEEEPKPKVQSAPRARVRSSDPQVGVDLAMGESSLEADEPITIGKMFKDTVSKVPDHAALQYKEGGEWKTITYSQYYRFCVQAAKSYLKLGLEPFGAVAIIGFNSPEWHISEVGAIFAGGLASGIYTTNSPEACRFVADNCKANVIVVENQKQLDKILEVRDRLPNLKAIVQYKGKLSEEYPNVYEWEQFLKLGEDVDDSVIEEKINAQRPEQCAVLIYTSGTTGNPKGVMLSHDNVTWTVKCVLDSYGEMLFATEHVVSYLPLSHAAGAIIDIYLPVLFAATVHFAQPDALKGSLVDTIRECQPTVFFGVPRVYEKMMERLQEHVADASGFRRRVATWAQKKGLKGNMRRQRSLHKPRGWKIADKLVFKKVREALGFQRCRIFVVGAAPTRTEVHEFYMSLDMPLMELYGMSESSGPETVNFMREGRWRVGSCGQTLSGVHIKIAEPDESGEGEICYYGRNVFMGYINNEEKTREAIDDQGWLHSGDIGRIDEDGFLYVTGRIKELIITSGGENIPPVPIEDAIKKEVPFLSNVMVIGDHRKFLSCLVTLKCEIDLDTGEPKDKLTHQVVTMLSEQGSMSTTVSEVIEKKDKAVFDAITKGIEQANKQATSRAQNVQKWRLLHQDFSIPGGELGPTLKLRRLIVNKKYAGVIDGMYEDGAETGGVEDVES